MNERDFTLLDDYFSEKLTPEQVREVRERAVSDPEFGAEFALRQEMENWPAAEKQRQALRETLTSISPTFFTAAGGDTGADTSMKMRVSRRRWILSLAATLLLAAIALWLLEKPEDHSLYASYAQHAPISLIDRGASDDAKQRAETAFNNRNWAAAIPAFDEILRNEPDNTTIAFSRAICLMETGDVAAARLVFESIASGTTALRDEAQWYLALSYLKDNDKANCRKALEQIPGNSMRFRKAKELLEKL